MLKTNHFVLVLGLPGILVSHVRCDSRRRKQPLGIVLRCRLYSLPGFCHQLYLWFLWKTNMTGKTCTDDPRPTMTSWNTSWKMVGEQSVQGDCWWKCTYSHVIPSSKSRIQMSWGNLDSKRWYTRPSRNYSNSPIYVSWTQKKKKKKKDCKNEQKFIYDLIW